MKRTSSNTQKFPVDSRLEERVEKAKSQRLSHEEHQLQEKQVAECLMPSREKDWIDDDDYDDDGSDEEFE